MRSYLLVSVISACLILPSAAMAEGPSGTSRDNLMYAALDEDRMISGDYPYEYIEREPPISNTTTHGAADNAPLEVAEIQRKKIRDPNVHYHVLLGVPISTSVSAGVSSASVFGSDFSASGDLDPDPMPTLEIRKMIWNDAPDTPSWSYGISLISVRGKDAGASASAGLIALPIHLCFRTIIGQSEEHPDGTLVPYGAVGAFYYFGNFKVDMGGSSGGLTQGIGIPDLRAGLQWNYGKGSSVLFELRYFAVSLDYSGRDYDIFNSDSASMDIRQTLMYLGMKSDF